MSISAVLMASGQGSLAQAIFDEISAGRLELNVLEVICDRPGAKVIERAQIFGVPTFIHPMQKDRSSWDLALTQHLETLHPDLVISLGFMRILSPELVAKFKVINTHPALLPAFPGAHAVRDALAAGVTKSGATIHWVDAGVDSGPIIAQVEVAVLPGDDESTLHERIKIVERHLLIETLKDLLPSLERTRG